MSGMSMNMNMKMGMKNVISSPYDNYSKYLWEQIKIK
jgi:hypothetical protein